MTKLILPHFSAALAVFAAFALAPPATAAPGDPDAFNPNADDRVNTAVVQADGKVIVGGKFLSIGGDPVVRIVRLDTDGTLDSGFTPSADDEVRCLAVQPDGKIIVGGRFTTVSMTPRNYIARLHSDGSLDTDFDPDLDNRVHCIALLPDGKMYIGGSFGTVGGGARPRIARLNADGSLDTDFNANIGGVAEVFSIAVQEDEKIVVGGLFSTIGGASRNNIARLDDTGAIDATFDPGTGPDDTVGALVVQPDGNILVAGKFQNVNGTVRNRFARLSSTGALEVGFDPDANNRVTSIALQADGKIPFVGYFTTLKTTGTPVSRNRAARLNADGTIDGFNPNLTGATDGISGQADGKLIICGVIATIGGQTRNRIGRVENDAATSTLTASKSRIQWLRGGTSPEAVWVTFESSTDGGTTWTPLGAGTRISGGWELTGLSLPTGATVRASAVIRGGESNGSSGIVEATSNVSTASTAPKSEPEDTWSVHYQKADSEFAAYIAAGNTNFAWAFYYFNKALGDFAFHSAYGRPADATYWFHIWIGAYHYYYFQIIPPPQGAALAAFELRKWYAYAYYNYHSTRNEPDLADFWFNYWFTEALSFL